MKIQNVLPTIADSFGKVRMDTPFSNQNVLPHWMCVDPIIEEVLFLLHQPQKSIKTPVIPGFFIHKQTTVSNITDVAPIVSQIADHNIHQQQFLSQNHHRVESKSQCHL